MDSVIIHGKRISDDSPRKGREDHDLWGVTASNTAYWNKELHDWTAWFDLHPVDPTPYHRGIRAVRPRELQWYGEQDTSRPIYLTDPHPEVPASVRFPIEDVVAAFPPPPDENPMFTCQVDYMMVFAYLQGYKRIVLNGIGINNRAQYTFNHRGIYYWIGLLRGRGLEIVIDTPSVYRGPELLYAYGKI
jgi:hypothetical protein